MKKNLLVCATCGHEVDGACDCMMASLHAWKVAFCRNCGDTGSHQPFTAAEKWKRARKLMGLSTKINAY